MRKPLPDQSALIKVLRYEEDSGRLYWKIAAGRRVRAGDLAGSQHPDGYWMICVFGRHYAAHRIIWKIVYGVDPINDVDHIDGNRSNNRRSNLRSATPLQNRQNKNGWGARRKGRKWGAQIQVNGRKIHLGTFESEEAARAAYVAAAREHFGEFARAA